MGASPILTFLQKDEPVPAIGASARARRRRYIVITAATALLSVASVPIAVEMLAGPNSQVPGASAARSFLDMMGYRSPGERTEARLQDKQRKAPFSAVLSERDSPAQPPPGMAMIAEGPEFAELAPFAEGPPSVLGFPSGPPIVPPGLAIVPPPGPPGPPGGSIPPGITPQTPPGPPPPPAPVPEPATWLTMLLGFGFIGGTIRRRRAALGLG